METGTVRTTMYRGRGRTSVGEGRKLKKGKKVVPLPISVGCSGRRERKNLSRRRSLPPPPFPLLVVFLEILLLEGPPYLPTT